MVDKAHRGKGLASGLLRTLREDGDDMYGVMSSHPHASLAAAKSFGCKCDPKLIKIRFLLWIATIDRISIDFIGENAKLVMSASPIPYIRDAELRGSVFDANDTSGIVSGVNTNFFVDHEEPSDALQSVQEELEWPLGGLPDGCEYLIIMEAKKRRSRSRSANVGQKSRVA